MNQHQTVTLRSPATGATALVLFDADLIATPASVHQIVALDRSGRGELTLLDTTLPIVFGIVGGVALIAGIFLGRKPHEATIPAAEPGQEHYPAAGLAGVVPGPDGQSQEFTTQAPEVEGPDASGAR